MSAEPALPTASMERGERIAAALLDLAYRNAPSGFVATFVVALLMVVAGWDRMPHPALIAWLATSTAVSLMRFAGVRAYARRSGGSPAALWGRRFTAGALASGLCWGALGGVLFPASSPLHQMVIGFALGGMVGGAAAFLSAVRLAYALYAMAAVLPFSARLLASGEVTQVSMGIMTVAFVASMLATSRNMNATLTENIFLRIEREDAAARLSTEQQRLEKQSKELASANAAALAGTQAKSDFLATMSHEIRTPLNAVVGMADLLEHMELSDEQREYVGAIRSSGDNLLALVSDILDFSKLEAGRVDIELIPFGITGCIDEAIGLVAPAAARKGLRLRREVTPSVPARIRSDPTRVRQILVNLLGNAVKFTPKGEVLVQVDARSVEGADPCAIELAFSVRDEGIGIAPEKLDRLFHRFSQVDASTTREYGGTGLGLAICQALVGVLGGRIAVESEPGRGSTFSFTILAAVEPSVPAVARRSPEAPATGDVRKSARAGRASSPDAARTMRVLLAEDNEVNQLVGRRMLERLGCEVDVVGNGRLVLESLKRAPYDVVLLDVQMPELDGIATAKRIVADWTKPARPRLVALTANALAGERERCLAAGMDDYLTKPVRMASLDAALLQVGRAVPEVTGALAVPAAPHEDDLLDRAVLEDLRTLESSVGIDLLGELVRSFLSDASAMMEEIHRALGAGDTTAVERASHKLKGGAATLGATEVASTARRVEQAAAAADLDAATRAVAELDLALERVDGPIRLLATRRRGAP